MAEIKNQDQLTPGEKTGDNQPEESPGRPGNNSRPGEGNSSEFHAGALSLKALRKKRTLLIIACTFFYLLVVVPGYLIFVEPGRAEVKRLQAEILEDVEVEEMRPGRAEVAELRERLAGKAGELPETAVVRETIELREAVSLARESGLRVGALQLMSEEGENKRLVYRVALAGDYARISDYVYRLESAGYPGNLSRLMLRNREDSQMLQVDITLGDR